MLTISRVPTLVSIYQEDSDTSNNSDSTTGNQAKECLHDRLRKCCMSVSKLVVYMFKKNMNESIVSDAASFSDEQEEPAISSFIYTLLGQWEDRMEKGLFRYDVTTCETKIIPGKYGFIAQLNEGRHLKKRPTEFRIDQVLQPFDENKFNFTKIGQEEVLFRFEPSDHDDDEAHFSRSSLVDASPSASPSVVAINVSPIEYGHVLLVPRVLDCLPQRIDHDSLLLALHFAKESADPFFRVGYNSLGAFATINHLHFQAYYLLVKFPVEKAPTLKVMTKKRLHGSNLTVSELLDYPVRGLVFEGGSTLYDICHSVARTCIYLQNKNIPYNLLIADCGKKVFLLPQCYAERQARGEVNQGILETHVNPAIWEISGHMVLKRKSDYDNASEESAWKLLSEVSLTYERFQKVKAYTSEAAEFKLEEVDTSSSLNQEEEEEEDILCELHATPHVTSSTLKQNCLVLH